MFTISGDYLGNIWININNNNKFNSRINQLVLTLKQLTFVFKVKKNTSLIKLISQHIKKQLEADLKNVVS